MKPIAQLSIEEVRLVVGRLHERVLMPQFELQTDQQFCKPGWGSDGPTRVCCTAEIRPIKSIPRVMAQYMDDTANADTLMAHTAQRALLDALGRMGLPTDAVEVPLPRSFFDGPPIDITGGMDAVEYIAKIRGEYIPKFKRGECGCGDCTWITEDIDTEFPVGGGWYRSWPCGSMPEGTYCSGCGSLLGPEGWAMLAGRDPKAVQWPEEVSTEPDRASTCTGAVDAESALERAKRV